MFGSRTQVSSGVRGSPICQPSPKTAEVPPKCRSPIELACGIAPVRFTHDVGTGVGASGFNPICRFVQPGRSDQTKLIKVAADSAFPSACKSGTTLIKRIGQPWDQRPGSAVDWLFTPTTRTVGSWLPMTLTPGSGGHAGGGSSGPRLPIQIHDCHPVPDCLCHDRPLPFNRTALPVSARR
jgi:hypothetical protein